MNFYQSLWPTFLAATILGIFPMLPVRCKGILRLNASKKFQLSTITVVVLFAANFVATILTRSNNLVGGTFYKKSNTVSNFGLTLVFILVLIIFCAIYFMSFKRTNYVADVMRQLHGVDKMFKTMNRTFQYRPFFWLQIVLTVLGHLMICVIAGIQNYNIHIENFPSISIYMWIVLIYPMVALNVLINQYAVTVLLIYQRLNMINRQLKKLQDLVKIKAEKSLSVARNGPIDIIGRLMRIHLVLHNAAHCTNLNYNVQMIPSLGLQYFTAVYSVFYYYWMHSAKPFSSICWICWGAMKSYEILLLSIFCHMASREAEIVGKSVHKVLICNRMALVEDKLVTFSQQVLQNKLRFTLCGLFNIDASLLFSMVGSSTTFIVIMIQFQEAAAPPQCHNLPE